MGENEKRAEPHREAKRGKTLNRSKDDSMKSGGKWQLRCPSSNRERDEQQGREG